MRGAIQPGDRAIGPFLVDLIVMISHFLRHAQQITAGPTRLHLD